MTPPERRSTTRRSLMRARTAAVAIGLGVAIVAAAPCARADDEIDPTSLRAEKLAEDAFVRASHGAHAEAVELYLQAHEAAPASALAFDIAWLYDQHLGAPALALDWYRRVLAAPDVTPELSARAQARVTSLDVSGKAAAGSVASGPPRDERGRGTTGSWSPLRTWAIVAGGAGLVALGVGTAFAIVAKNKDSEAAGYCDGDRCTDARALTLTSDATSAASVANVAIVTGAVFLATGVTLWLLAPRRGALDVRASARWFVLGGSFP